MPESWLICEKGYQTKCVDCPIRDENAEPCEHAIEVAPVQHSRWAHIGGDEWCCPVCGFVITTEGSWEKPTKKYCEDCGTKMDGSE